MGIASDRYGTISSVKSVSEEQCAAKYNKCTPRKHGVLYSNPCCFIPVNVRFEDLCVSGKPQSHKKLQFQQNQESIYEYISKNLTGDLLGPRVS